MRRIKKAKISYISLVPKGANRLPVLYKADSQVAEFRTLLKTSDNFDELGELTAVVYVPEFRDRQGDIASVEVVKQMAYDFQRDGGQIDIRHNNDPVGTERAYVAENFLIQKNDPRFEGMTDYEGNEVDVTDGWGIVIKIDDPELRKQYRDGEWNGVSMEGPALVEPDEVSKMDALVDQFSKLLKGEIDMDKKEMAELLKESNESLAKTLGDSFAEALKTIKPEVKKEEVKKEETKTVEVEFEGDPTDPDDLRTHLAKVEVANLDMNDPKCILKLIKQLDGEETDGDFDDDPKIAKMQKQMKRLEKRLLKAQGKSNQDGGGSKDTLDPSFSMMTKEELEGVEVGSDIAKYANQMLGTHKE